MFSACAFVPLCGREKEIERDVLAYSDKSDVYFLCSNTPQLECVDF